MGAKSWRGILRYTSHTAAHTESQLVRAARHARQCAGQYQKISAPHRSFPFRRRARPAPGAALRPALRQPLRDEGHPIHVGRDVDESMSCIVDHAAHHIRDEIPRRLIEHVQHLAGLPGGVGVRLTQRLVFAGEDTFLETSITDGRLEFFQFREETCVVRSGFYP